MNARPQSYISSNVYSAEDGSVVVVFCSATHSQSTRITPNTSFISFFLATIWQMGGAIGSLAQAGFSNLPLSVRIMTVTLYTIYMVLGTETRTVYLLGMHATN